jgi:S-adenosylmethionine:tRNA ribosyltransferase-isomerase
MSTTTAVSFHSPISFMLPPELVAKEPPERRGIARDAVRLMVIDRSENRIYHTRFYGIGKFLLPGDLMVFNTSRTIPASLVGNLQPAGPLVEVRLAEHLVDDSWLALLRCQQSNEPFSCGIREGMQIEFTHGLVATVYNKDERIQRLWKIGFSKSGNEFFESLYRIGQPIRYDYVSEPWDLDYYQTVYATNPGSAEMPSAGRPFTWKLLFELKRNGINMTHISLHTGLSSYMDSDLDQRHVASEEEYFVNSKTAEQINKTHDIGGRVIAVGTTVVRALETATIGDSNKENVKPGHAYTRLHIDANHRLKAVDGLLTGLHEPNASHLDLLSAFLPAKRIQQAYDEAIRQKYLWHEFGDMNLILQKN